MMGDEEELHQGPIDAMKSRLSNAIYHVIVSTPMLYNACKLVFPQLKNIFSWILDIMKL